MPIALNGNSTIPYPFLMDIRIARETGYEGIVLVSDKLRRYLAQGFTLEEARAAIDDLPVLGFTNVWDIDRVTTEGRAQLFAECEETCRLARSVGCSQIQLLTGPVDPSGPYRGPLGMDAGTLRRETASNLRRIGAIGQRYQVGFYVEPLVWTLLRDLREVVRILEEAGQDNVGLGIDFWHLWNAGVEPDDVAKIDGAMIRSVDVGDGLGPRGTRAGADQQGRGLWPGEGEIPLRAWVDAVRATGFDGTWSYELYSSKHWQLDPWKTAADLRHILSSLLNSD